MLIRELYENLQVILGFDCPTCDQMSFDVLFLFEDYSKDLHLHVSSNDICLCC